MQKPQARLRAPSSCVNQLTPLIVASRPIDAGDKAAFDRVSCL